MESKFLLKFDNYKIIYNTREIEIGNIDNEIIPKII